MNTDEIIELSGKLLEPKNQKKIAKITMTASLATLCITAFSGSKAARTIHIAAGVTLVGAALWHATLYGDNSVTRASKRALKAVKEIEAADK